MYIICLLYTSVLHSLNDKHKKSLWCFVVFLNCFSKDGDEFLTQIITTLWDEPGFLMFHQRVTSVYAIPLPLLTIQATKVQAHSLNSEGYSLLGLERSTPCWIYVPWSHNKCRHTLWNIKKKFQRGLFPSPWQCMGSCCGENKIVPCKI